MAARTLLPDNEFAKYPITIYTLGVQALIVIAVPFAFVSFFPTAFLFGMDAWSAPGLLTPLVALLLHALRGVDLPARPAPLRKHRPLSSGHAADTTGLPRNSRHYPLGLGPPALC